MAAHTPGGADPGGGETLGPVQIDSSVGGVDAWGGAMDPSGGVPVRPDFSWSLEYSAAAVIGRAVLASPVKTSYR
jgi:hypothetical protein